MRWWNKLIAYVLMKFKKTKLIEILLIYLIENKIYKYRLLRKSVNKLFTERKKDVTTKTNKPIHWKWTNVFDRMTKTFD